MRNCKSAIIPFRNQRGAALPMVIMVMILMCVLSAAAYQISQGNTGLIAMASSNERALYAAEQGYNRTLWRLNNEATNFLITEDPNPTEEEYGNEKYYNLYELTAGPNYRLNVLVPLVDIAGNKTEDKTKRIIRSTGWDAKKPDRLRSIEVEVYKKSFTQFAMANDSEKDISGNPLYWLTGEVVYGPLHTNDTLFVTGTPIFYGSVTYVNGIDITPAANIYNPAIFRQGNSQVSAKLSFPPSNPELKAYARINGDYYNGRTCIYLRPDGGYDARYYDQSTQRWFYNDVEYAFVPKNGNNRWQISELINEAATNINSVMFQKIERDSDGNINDRIDFPSFDSFAASVGHLSLPENGVIYVDGATTGGSTGTSFAESKFAINLGNVYLFGQLSGRLTIAAANNIYITAHNPCDWKRPSWDSSWYASNPGVTYSNTTFTQVFENGAWSHTEVGGNSGKDLLGLVASNYVNVMHYNWPSQYDEVRFTGDLFGILAPDNYCWTFANSGIPIDHAPDNIFIQAAVYAQDQSFGFEAADIGSEKDTCYVVGAIAQKYRGQQGGFLDGYIKNYSHDPRLLYDAPPHFPNPANSGWQSSRWDEINDHIQ